jgi:hypothetical protein
MSILNALLARVLQRLVAELTAAGLLTQEIMRKNAGVPGASHRHSVSYSVVAACARTPPPLLPPCVLADAVIW